MKTIQKIADKLGLKVAELNFRGNGFTDRGYALYSEDQNNRTGWVIQLGKNQYPEVIVFEPKNRMSGKCWGVSDHRKDFGGYRELKPKEFSAFLL